MNKQTRSKPTLVTFVLDETGSMGVVKQQTIAGFNEYVDTLRKSEAKIVMSLTKFNSKKTDTIYSGLRIQEVPPLTDASYMPEELTPLFDAVGKGIVSVDAYLAKQKAQHRALPKVLFVIMTDGEENASKEYLRQTVFQMVQDREKQGWTFVFLGANQEAFQSAQKIGIQYQNNTLSYAVADTGTTFAAVAGATVAYTDSTDVSTKEFFKK